MHLNNYVKAQNNYVGRLSIDDNVDKKF